MKFALALTTRDLRLAGCLFLCVACAKSVPVSAGRSPIVRSEGPSAGADGAPCATSVYVPSITQPSSGNAWGPLGRQVETLWVADTPLYSTVGELSLRASDNGPPEDSEGEAINLRDYPVTWVAQD